MEESKVAPSTQKPNKKSGPVLALILVFLVLAGYYLMKNFSTDQSTDTKREDKQETSIQKQDSKNEKSLYYTLQPIGSKDSPFTKIYRLGQIGVQDELTIKFDKHLKIESKLKEKNAWLASASDGLYIVRPELKEVEHIVETTEEEIITAYESPDTSTIAYTTRSTGDFELTGGHGTTGSVALYNIDTKERETIYENSELGDLMVTIIMGWASNKELMIGEKGGDAGYVWGDTSVLNTETKQKTEITVSEEENMAFQRTATLSPSGEYISYIQCPGKSDEPIIETCPEGQQLISLNGKTGKKTVLYQNKEYGNNTEVARLRMIFSHKWKDEKTITYATPDGLFDINIDTNETEEVYKLNWNDPDVILRGWPTIMHSDGEYIALLSLPLFGQYAILDRKSNRVISLGGQDTEETFINQTFR